MKKNKSFFIYIHDDLSGDPEVNKIGRAMTPYSAVRLRQRFMSKLFELNYFFFGHPDDIHKLETHIKFTLKSVAVRNRCQRELFRKPIDEILTIIHDYIEKHHLRVARVDMGNTKYSAHNSRGCPLKIPSEKKSYNYLISRIPKIFNGTHTHIITGI